MRQVTRKGLMTVAAATGVLAVTGGYAHADSEARGTASGSPGVLSGNSVQVPVHVPVNVCGNTVNVVGVLDPAVGTTCAGKGAGSGPHGNGGSGHHGPGGGSQAGGHTGDSPGVGSGNQLRVPVDVPVDVCGNGISVAGVGNTATGSGCGNTGGGDGVTPPGPGRPNLPGKPGDPGRPDGPGNGNGYGHPAGSHADHRGTQALGRSDGSASLAETGSGVPLGLALPLGAGTLLAGAVLYRKARPSA